MYQIRSSVFETNSSSTHSICIDRTPVKQYPSHIHFRTGEYGWENGEYDLADYLFTAICELYDAGELEDKLNHVREVLARHDIECDFQLPDKHSYWWGIDHSYETAEFVNAVMSNDDLLLRALFGSESCVYTGNDNEEREVFPMKDCCDATYWDWETGKEVPNPDHHPDKYEYFSKGN